MKQWHAIILVMVFVAAGCTTTSLKTIDVQLNDEWLKPYQQTSASIFFYNRDSVPYRNVRIGLVDDGILDGRCEGDAGELNPGDVLMGHCSFKAGDVLGDAIIKYSISFSSHLSLLVPDIEVISEEEWTKRQYKGGTTKEISRSIQDNNVRLDVVFDDPMPLKEGDGTIMRIKISNIGNGFIEGLKPGMLKIKDPSGIIKKCYSMKKNGNVFMLESELPVIKQGFEEIDCFVEPQASEVLNIYNVNIELDYNYKIMDTFTMRVVE